MMEENRICLGYLDWCEREEVKFSELARQNDNATEIARNIDNYDAGMLKLLDISCSVIADLVIFSKGQISDSDLIHASLSVPDFEGCNPNIIVILVWRDDESGSDIYRKKIKDGELMYSVESIRVKSSDIYRTIGKSLYFSVKY